ISTNRSSPSTEQWVNVTVETDSSYRGKVEFYLQYRTSSSSSWSKVTSSSYFTADDEFDDGYKFTSSDRGTVTFNSFIKFKKSGYYRLYVEDDNGNENYIQFNVDTSSSSSDDIEISTNRSSPSTEQWVNVTVETDSSYRGKVEFYLQYRTSSSSSWSKVTSSSYFTADDEFDDGYKFTSSDKGTVTFNSFIKFKKSGYYRLYVEDDNGNENYIQFNVDTSSSSNDDIEISTNNKSPDKNTWINLTVSTDSSYRGKVEFTVKYKDGSNWKTTTSSSYYEVSDDYNSDFKNGYTMGSSDKGEVTFKKIIRFKKDLQYRIYVEDKNGNENYIAFNVGNGSNDDDSNVAGFTKSEYKKIKNVSNIWNDVIAQLKRNSYTLRNDNYRQRLSDTLYDNMRDVVNDKRNRTFEDWQDFMDAFNTWYRYTARNS
ncbi:MAG: hypothetical protein LBH96_00230, partial [Candidatus Peribacteria bacterium]|nr:hypothetical protein [Candidatus Peribacteria bacterium]